MLNNEIREKVNRGLHNLQPVDFGVALGLTALATILSAGMFVYYWGYRNGWDDFSIICKIPPLASKHSNLSLSSFLRLTVTMALTLSGIALWSRRVTGFFISVFALLWIAIAYVWWYLNSLAFMEAMEISDYSQVEVSNFKHIGILYDATWLDIVILTIAAFVFIWHIKSLIQMLKHSLSAT